MHFRIVTSAVGGSTFGNRVTAERWALHLIAIGHSVEISSSTEPSSSVDCLIGLHANFSCDAISQFRHSFPDRPAICVVTGTDLHVDLQNGGDAARRVRRSLSLACKIVTLEPACVAMLEPEFQAKTVTILQSAKPVDVPALSETPSSMDRPFRVAVVGHLRDEKDPLAAAEASRLLPIESNIQIQHWGEAITSTWSKRATQETATNPRYEWLGPVDFETSQAKLASADIMVISSLAEGAPAIISESIVNGVPILAHQITATVGLLGADYPGFYTGASRQQLAKLLQESENDAAFRERLIKIGRGLKPKFAPRVEQLALQSLIDSISTR